MYCEGDPGDEYWGREFGMHKGLRYMYNSGPGLTELRGVFGKDLICLQSDLVALLFGVGRDG